MESTTHVDTHTWAKHYLKRGGGGGTVLQVLDTNLTKYLQNISEIGQVLCPRYLGPGRWPPRHFLPTQGKSNT